MYKRKKEPPTIIGDSSSSSDDCSENLQGIKKFVSKNYVRQKRRHTIEVNISDTSSDEELHQQNQLEQENRKWAPNLKRYSSDPKPLTLSQHNKYQPLSLSITSKSPSPAKRTNILVLDSICSTTPVSPPATSRAAWRSFRQTLTARKRDCTGILQSQPSRNNSQGSLDETALDCTLNTSLEANMETMIDTQQSLKVKKVHQKKLRCIKGGYLYEFKQLMLKECMDRRSLAQNQRLGISSGQRAHVLSISESFGVHMAQVKAEEADKGIFNIILSRSMAAMLSIGAILELYFDLEPETALRLPNNELVYVHPNKLVLL